MSIGKRCKLYVKCQPTSFLLLTSSHMVPDPLRSSQIHLDPPRSIQIHRDPWRTWNMVPHPRGEMLSSMDSSNRPRSRKWEKTPKPKIRPVLYNVFSQFYQKSNMILWSIRTFWYKGSAENKKQRHVREKWYISQKQQPKTQHMISQKHEKYMWILHLRNGFRMSYPFQIQPNIPN